MYTKLYLVYHEPREILSRQHKSEEERIFLCAVRTCREVYVPQTLTQKSTRPVHKAV